MSSTSPDTKLATLPAPGRPRPEALESWAEGKIKPVARVRAATTRARADEDYFVRRNGVEYAGTHLLIDLWRAQRLDDLQLVEATLREAVSAVGATLLHIHVHGFTPNRGVSGIAVLAESHISIHTWPESGYAALDIFVCGDCDPYAAIPILRRAFSPGEVRLGEHKRGLTV
jgi:S-adenosylmethionine decarboxylase